MSDEWTLDRGALRGASLGRCCTGSHVDEHGWQYAVDWNDLRGWFNAEKSPSVQNQTCVDHDQTDSDHIRAPPSLADKHHRMGVQCQSVFHRPQAQRFHVLVAGPRHTGKTAVIRALSGLSKVAAVAGWLAGWRESPTSRRLWPTRRPCDPPKTTPTPHPLCPVSPLKSRRRPSCRCARVCADRSSQLVGWLVGVGCVPWLPCAQAAGSVVVVGGRMHCSCSCLPLRLPCIALDCLQRPKAKAVDAATEVRLVQFVSKSDPSLCFIETVGAADAPRAPTQAPAVPQTW